MVIYEASVFHFEVELKIASELFLNLHTGFGEIWGNVRLYLVKGVSTHQRRGEGMQLPCSLYRWQNDGGYTNFRIRFEWAGIGTAALSGNSNIILVSTVCARLYESCMPSAPLI